MPKHIAWFWKYAHRLWYLWNWEFVVSGCARRKHGDQPPARNHLLLHHRSHLHHCMGSSREERWCPPPEIVLVWGPTYPALETLGSKHIPYVRRVLSTCLGIQLKNRRWGFMNIWKKISMRLRRVLSWDLTLNNERGVAMKRETQGPFFCALNI